MGEESLRPMGKESFPGHFFSAGIPVDSLSVDTAYSTDIVLWNHQPEWGMSLDGLFSVAKLRVGNARHDVPPSAKWES